MPPTCTEQGYTEHVCDCEYSYKDAYVDASGHSFGDWIPTTSATCTADGTERRDCNNCDHFETRTTDATGHTYTDTVVPPTCTEQGYTEHVCDCEYSYKDSYVNEKGHSYTVSKTTPPTCVDQGYTEHVCSCGESYKDAYVAALGHNYGNWVTINSANCTRNGIERRDCNNCDYYEIKNTPAGHSCVSVQTPATCTRNGYSYERCTKCNYENIKVLYTKGHTITDYYTYNEPSCTISGSCSGYCDICDEYVEITLFATGHTAGDFVFGNDYCGTQKLGYVSCIDCGELIAKFGHSYEETIIKPTCTENGQKTYTCIHCGDSYNETIDASGHIPGEWIITTQAKCNIEGERVRYCISCNEIVVSTTIAAISHSYTSQITADGILYTCIHCDDFYTVSITDYVTLSFICNGEKACADLQIPKGMYSLLPVLEKENLSFNGWYLDEQLTNKCLETHVFSSDTTLYGAWINESISGEANTNNLITNAPLSFTFSIMSEVPLTNDNLSNYIFITDLNDTTPSLFIKAEDNGVYTIGSNGYVSGMTYKVLIREQLSFTETDGKELWFITEKENTSKIKYKDGTYLLSKSSIYACYEQDGKLYIFTLQDVLDPGENVVIYGKDLHDALVAIKIVAEGAYENLSAYQIDIADFDSVFTEFDIYYSGDLNVEDIDFAENIQEALTAQLMSSSVYARFEYATSMLAGFTVGDYYYDSNGVKVNPNFKTEGTSLYFSVEIVAEFARMHVETREVDSLFTITLEVKCTVEFILTAQVSSVDNFMFAVEAKNTTEANFYASIHDEKHDTESKELSYFKKFFDDAKNSGKFPSVDPSSASEQKELPLGTISIPIYCINISLNLTNVFDFEAVGKIGVGTKINVSVKLGIQNTPGTGLGTIQSFKASATTQFYMMGKITVADTLKLEINVSLLGIVNAYINASVGPYFEMGGMLSATFSTTGVNSFVASGYLEIGVKVNARAGVNAKLSIWWFGWKTVTLFDEEWVIYDENFALVEIGEKKVPLYFVTPKETYPLNYTCGTRVDLSQLLNTSVMVQNFENMTQSTEKVNCKYYLNGSYSGVSISEAGILTVKGDCQEKTIQIKITCGNIYKLVDIKLSMTHVHAKVTYIAPTCTKDGRTEYTYCQSCSKILSGEKSVIPALGHSYEDWYTVTPATCTTQGKERRDCENCDHYETKVISATGHSYEAWYTTLAPTCTADGSERRDCKNCEQYETNVLNATGHSYVSHVVTPPTCTERGYTTHTCHCEHSYVDTYVSATGHSYVHVVTPPTCTERGYTTHTCHCNNTYVDSYTSATGHSYEAIVTPPTCTERGYTTHDCVNCEDYYIDTYVAANDHTDNGRGICSVCGSECDHYHSYTQKNTDSKYYAYDATCTIPTKYYYSCTCKAIGTETFEVGEALGHSYEPIITAPTCFKKGYTTHLCHCGDSYQDTFTDPVSYVDKNQDNICDHCGSSAGLYDVDGNIIAIWDELVNIYGMDVTQNYTSTTYNTVKTTPGYVLKKNEALTNGKKLIIGNVKNIGKYAFYSMGRLTDIVIPDSVLNIDQYAFYYCSNLASIKIGSGVTNIGYLAFEKSSNLKKVYIDDLSSWCAISLYDHRSSPLYYAEELYLKDKLITDLVVPDNVTKIGNWAFYFLECLKTVDTNCVVTIGKEAFKSCTNMESVRFGDALTTIGDSAFASCDSLTEVRFPARLTSLGSGAFAECDILHDVYITDLNAWFKVTFGGTFIYCYENPTVWNLHLNDQLITDLVIPNGITSFNTHAFSGSSIVSVVIPDSVTVIKGGFANCFNLQNVIMGNGVKTIETNLFARCNNLTSVTLSKNLTSIAAQAFNNCSSLTELNYNGTVLEWYRLTLYENWLYNTPVTKVICSNGTVSLT